MKINFSHVCKSVVMASVLVGLVVGVAAWDDDGEDALINRPEFVTRGVGDAQEVNKATQTINPWPKYVKDRNLTVDGRRAAVGIQRYQQNRSVQPRSLNTTSAFVQTDVGVSGTPNSGNASATESVNVSK